MSSAGLGATTTLLGGSPSGQAASHVNNQTQFTLVLGGGGMKGVAHVGVLQALTERGFVPAQVVGSSVLPGYLPPREIRGRFYMDGATVDNLPVGTARILGSDVIIAVDVSASNAFRADTQDEGFASVFARAAEIAMQTILELRLREWTTPPIYYIHPRVEHISAFDFDHLREVVEEGYRATVAALDRPEEWPAPGDSGVHPRRPVSVRVQRDRCIGCTACLLQAPPVL